MKLIQNIYIGSKFKYYRTQKDYSQIDVVRQMQLYGSDLSDSSYAKIEQGNRNIFLDDFIILKIVLEFNYALLFDEYEIEIRKIREDHKV